MSTKEANIKELFIGTKNKNPNYTNENKYKAIRRQIKSLQ